MKRRILIAAVCLALSLTLAACSGSSRTRLSEAEVAAKRAEYPIVHNPRDNLSSGNQEKYTVELAVNMKSDLADICFVEFEFVEYLGELEKSVSYIEGSFEEKVDEIYGGSGMLNSSYYLYKIKNLNAIAEELPEQLIMDAEGCYTAYVKDYELGGLPDMKPGDRYIVLLYCPIKGTSTYHESVVGYGRLSDSAMYYVTDDGYILSVPGSKLRDFDSYSGMAVEEFKKEVQRLYKG